MCHAGKGSHQHHNQRDPSHSLQLSSLQRPTRVLSQTLSKMDLEDGKRPFTEVLHDMAHPKKKRDPRVVRLAAVTSAITEVLGKQDCSASKVYAKTVTAIEGTLSSSNGTVEESISTQQALLQLLSTTIPYVNPPSIVIATLPLVSRVLRAIVSSTRAIGDETVLETKDELGGVISVLRWTCRASSEVCKCLEPRADDKAVKQFLLGTLVTLMRDRRAKVRKGAQEGVLETLLLQETDKKCHPVITKTLTAYVHNEITKTAKNQSMESFGSILQLLPFIEGTILYLSYEQLGNDIMELLALLLKVDDMAIATDFITTAKIRAVSPKIQTINALLSVVTHLLDDKSAKKNDFLNGFASRVLATQLQSKPNLVFRRGAADFEVLEHGKIQFGQALLAAAGRLVNTNVEMMCRLLPLICQFLVLLSRPSEESPNDGTVAETLLVELTQFLRMNLSTMIDLQPPSLEKCLRDMLLHIGQIMQPYFNPAWSVGLKCMVIFLGNVHSIIDIGSNVDSLVRLRDDVPIGSPLQHIVEDSLSTLVQEIGIEKCWGMIHFSADPAKDGIDTGRSWILPTLKTAISAATPVPLQLSFFLNIILSLARTCDKLATVSGKDRLYFRARVVDLWSFFPCFCKSPADIGSTLPALTTTLVRAIQDKRYPELVPIICSGISALGKGQQAEFLSSESLDQKSALEGAAVTILPVLFKLVSDYKKVSNNTNDVDGTGGVPSQGETSALQDGVVTRSISEAISALAQLAPKDFLHSLFQKVMHRLLEEVQSDVGDREKICSLLTLSESLVSSEALDVSSISFLYRALTPLIRDDAYGARVQKRAYKVLVEICQHHHSFVSDIDRLKELSALLSGTIMTSQVAARYMRLRCLNIIIEGLGEEQKEHLSELSTTLGEVLLCLKDSNGKSREEAYQVFLALASRSDVTEFLKAVTAGLGAETPHMRSASVMALSRLVFTYAWNDTTFQTLLPSLLQTVLVLINEDSREVIKSVIGFVRISVSAIPSERLESVLPEVVESLMTYQKKKDRFRAKIKIILKKLIKVFGYEKLMPYVPESETRLLTHMRKLDERQKRKKAAQRELRMPAEEFDDMLNSDEEDSDDGRTFMSGATGFSRLTGKSGVERSIAGKSVRSKATRAKTLATVASKKSTSGAVRLPDQMDGDVVDMLGSKMSRRVHFQDNDSDNDDDSSGAMEFNDDGMLIVPDGEEGINSVPIEKPSLHSIKKRRLEKGCDSSTKTGLSRKSDNNKALGAAYKSKRAGGDVRKKGQKYEPYAFMPLDGRSYSKKNRRAAVEKMSTVVRGNSKRKRN